MFLLDEIAQARITGAIARGEFDDLPGAGKPLRLDDDSHVPQEFGAAYRVLKNAGLVPPEVELRREVSHVEDLLAAARDAAERGVAARRLTCLTVQLNLTRHDKVDMRLQEVLPEAPSALAPQILG